MTQDRNKDLIRRWIAFANSGFVGILTSLSLLTMSVMWVGAQWIDWNWNDQNESFVVPFRTLTTPSMT